MFSTLRSLLPAVPGLPPALSLTSVVVGVIATVVPLTRVTTSSTVGGSPITSLKATGPAERAGLQVGDVILRVGSNEVMTTHDLSEAQVTDHVVLLSGRVVAAGSPQEVLTADNLAEAYGPALLHVDEGRIFIDDAAHMPTEGRHVHRERSIHTEASPTDAHGH